MSLLYLLIIYKQKHYIREYPLPKAKIGLAMKQATAKQVRYRYL
jgi:hypothetical protein